MLFLGLHTPTARFYPLPLHDALPILDSRPAPDRRPAPDSRPALMAVVPVALAVLMTARATGTTAISAGLESGADRKSTRLNSSHPSISYAVFCLKKKTHTKSTNTL